LFSHDKLKIFNNLRQDIIVKVERYLKLSKEKPSFKKFLKKEKKKDKIIVRTKKITLRKYVRSRFWSLFIEFD